MILVQPQLWTEIMLEVRPFVSYILMSSPVRYGFTNYTVPVNGRCA